MGSTTWWLWCWREALLAITEQEAMDRLVEKLHDPEGLVGS